MDRRNFLSAAGAAAAVGLASTVMAQGQAPKGEGKGNQFLELRKYLTVTTPNKALLEKYLSDAAIPAWNRAGITSVGVFTVTDAKLPPAIYVLMPHPNLESLITTPAAILQDAEYTFNAEEFMKAPMKDPAFVRLESTLMRAFDGLPQVAVPPQKVENKKRIFELRIYESSSPTYAKKKIEMFNEGGEIGIFKKCGCNPVFYGETLVGPIMPNLHYMLCFDDLAAKDAGWKAFRDNPDWKKLSADPKYADTVSHITDIMLAPTEYSQL